MYPLLLDDAERKLIQVADLHRESPTPSVVLMVGSGQAVRRMEITYIKTEQQTWEFSNLATVLTAGSPAQVPPLFRRIESHLRKRLGKPAFTIRRDTPLPLIGWKLKGSFELWLREETGRPPPDGGPPERQIQIGVAEPSGEAD